MGLGSFLKVLAANFDVLAGPVVSLAYPLYASIQAIETKSPIDDQQWLTYWVLYSMITLFELTFAKVIEWLPFWSYTKLIATCWLVLPYFNGAAYVYEHFVRPMFVNRQTINIWYVPWGKKDPFSKPDDILTAAEKYIQENGPDAFENIISKSKYQLGGPFLSTKVLASLPTISLDVSFDASIGLGLGKFDDWNFFLKGASVQTLTDEQKLVGDIGYREEAAPYMANNEARSRSRQSNNYMNYDEYYTYGGIN